MTSSRDNPSASSPAHADTLDAAVAGMHCASCAARIESAVARLDGVATANVNFAARHLRAHYDGALVSREKIAAAVSSLGYSLIAELQDSADPFAAARVLEEREYRDHKRRAIVALVLVALIMALDMRLHALVHDPAVAFIITIAEFLLALPVWLWCGLPFLRGAVLSFRRMSADMNTLIAIGTTSAFLYSTVALFFPMSASHVGGMPGIYFDTTATIIAFVLLGLALEARVRGRTGDTVRALIALKPDTVTVRREGGETTLAVKDLKIDDIVIIKPGERIATDGTVLDGESVVDESMITGESMPVPKKSGDLITGGTVNGNGSLVFRVLKTGADTVLAQIIRLVAEAQTSKAPIQRYADVVSARFVPAVLVTAAVTFAAWLFFATSPDFATALNHAIAVLIIACPCALGLATPTAIMAGTGRGARMGILIRTAAVLETARGINDVVFDKTGTLTEGRPRVTDVLAAPGWKPYDLLRLAGSVESRSEHPMAAAIVVRARKGYEVLPEPESFRAVPGRGAEAVVMSRRVAIGNRDLFTATALFTLGELADEWKSLENAGKTVAGVTVDGAEAGIIAVADTLRETARDAVIQLKSMGIVPHLITGDNPRTAAAIGTVLGIRNILAAVKPEGKSAEIAKFKSGGRITAMVGDGINDAPALAVADVGMAMATGTDIAMASAPVTLMRGDLTLVPKTIALSRAVMRVIRQNLFLSFAYNTLAIPIAAGVFESLGVRLTPALSALAMALSSLTVVLNSLRLRGWRG